jgi:hypothetical protein
MLRTVRRVDRGGAAGWPAGPLPSGGTGLVTVTAGAALMARALAARREAAPRGVGAGIRAHAATSCGRSSVAASLEIRMRMHGPGAALVRRCDCGR